MFRPSVVTNLGRPAMEELKIILEAKRDQVQYAGMEICVRDEHRLGKKQTPNIQMLKSKGQSYCSKYRC